MSVYKDCTQAHQLIRQRCGVDPGAPEYDACVRSLNVHKTPEDCTSCGEASTCIVDGNSQKLFVCLTDGAKEPQVVRSTSYMGNPSKVVQK